MATTGTAPARARPASATPAPRWLWVLAGSVVGIVLLPLGYLGWTVVANPAWNLLLSARTAQLLVNTVLLTVSVSITAATIGVAAAWVIARLNISFRRTWMALLALPLVVPSYVGALVMVAATGPRGLISDVFAIEVPRMGGFWGAWLSLSLFTYPYVFLVATVVLRRIDPTLEEAARGLGASSGKAFRTITLPQLRPAIGASVLLVALYTISDFGAVSLMRYDTLTRAIYTQWSARLDRAPALTLAVLLILLAAVVLWAEQRSRGRAEYYSPRPVRTTRLFDLTIRGQVTTYTFLGTVITLALVIPVGVLGFWLVRGLNLGEPIGATVFGPALRSLGVSLVASLAAVLAAIPIAVLAVRFPGRWSSRMERSVWAVYALPHITVGVAVLYFTVTFLTPLYQSLFVLVTVYVAIFLPQATGAAQAALRQVNPHVEEASRSLGRTSLGTLIAVTVPMISRGLLSGGTLVFLTVMKELPATLLLRPTGFDTLALRIWEHTKEGFYTRASAASLVLLLISAVPMYFLATRELRHA